MKWFDKSKLARIKSLAKFLTTTAAVLILLLLLISLLLQIPVIQTQVVKRITASLSKKLEMPVNIESVHIAWFDEVKLHDILIRDPYQDTLIYAEDILIDFHLGNVLDQRITAFDLAKVENAVVKVRKNNPEDDVSMTVFARNLRELFKSPPGGENNKKKPFRIASLFLKNSRFSLIDNTKDSLSDRWDFNHFTLENINARLSEMIVINDTFQIKIHKLTGNDQSTKFPIHNLAARFRFSQQAMELKDLSLQAGQSEFNNDLTFLYDGSANLSYFNDSVTVKSNLQDATIHSKDLGLFAPYFKQFDEDYHLSGNVDGKVSQFSLSDFKLKFGYSLLAGDLEMNGLPEIAETFIFLNVNQSNIRAIDLQKYIEPKVYSKIDAFGNILFTGRFLGFVDDFVANGDFKTNLGNLTSDINLKLSEDRVNSTYSGGLKLDKFNIGELIGNDSLIQRVSMNGQLSGRGLTEETADLNLNAVFQRLDIRNYSYSNIVTSARFAKELFIGKLTINDKNIKLSTNALIDLQRQNKILKVSAEIDSMHLQPLNLSQKPMTLSTKANIRLNGFQLDSLLGDIYINDFYISQENQKLNIDSIAIIAQKNQDERLLLVNSPNFNFTAAGDYNISHVAKDISRQLKEYKLRIKNKKEELDSYYANKDTIPKSNFYVKYNLEIKDINPILQLFAPSVELSRNTNIEGVYMGGYTSLFSIKSNLDSIRYGKYLLLGNELDIHTFKNFNSPEITADAQIQSAYQHFGGKQSTDSMQLNLLWNENHIDLKFDIAQTNSDNYLDLIGQIDFLPDRTQIHFDPSMLYILEKEWHFQENNKIIIAQREVTFENFKMSHLEQDISLSGKVSENENEKLVVDIHNLQLDVLNTLLDRKHQGEIEGSLLISNFYKGIIVESDITVDSLRLNNFLIGNLHGQSYWDNKLGRLNVAADLFREGSKKIALAGYLEPKSNQQIHAYAYLNDANLSMVEPFTVDFFSNLRGEIDGEYQIEGTLSEPLITGKGSLNKGKVTVNYLNTTYDFDADLKFDRQTMLISSMTLYDEDKNISNLKGTIKHNKLKDFRLDVGGTLNNFKVLNKSAKDGDMYYGVAKVTGDIRFYGPIDNLTISSQATTNRGTRFFIPLSETASVEQQDFIQIINKKDKKLAEVAKDVKDVDLKGLNLDFDLDVTPDAYCEIIFDLTAGDIIRGRGDGKLKMQINTEGDFNMFGQVEILEGAYNFTLYNVINKEFDILPNSTLTWSGDPFKADMDIKASYNQLASLTPLFEDTTFQNLTEVRRKYPAKVLLNLQGDLMSPEINFDIEIENYPNTILVNRGGGAEAYSLAARMDAFENTLNNDEQELKRQVFSLMVLRRFSPENSFNVSGSFGNSVSEFISNQLSYWVTQFDENLEIDVDLGSMDDEAFNTFQLRLSYTFMEGRLRITRDGGFTNQQNQPDITSIAGDWTLEYFLTADGKLRVKMYNRTNFNNFDPGNEANATTTAGFSLMHTESFDKVVELFQNSRKQNRNNKEDESANSDAKKEEDLDPFTKK